MVRPKPKSFVTILHTCMCYKFNLKTYQALALFSFCSYQLEMYCACIKHARPQKRSLWGEPGEICIDTIALKMRSWFKIGTILAAPTKLLTAQPGVPQQDIPEKETLKGSSDIEGDGGTNSFNYRLMKLFQVNWLSLEPWQLTSWVPVSFCDGSFDHPCSH